MREIFEIANILHKYGLCNEALEKIVVVFCRYNVPLAHTLLDYIIQDEKAKHTEEFYGKNSRTKVWYYTDTMEK